MRYFLVALTVLLLFVGFFVMNKEPEKSGTPAERGSYVIIGGQKVHVDLAASEAEREQGLSGRSGLPENTGMLFIFEKPGRYSFWMKDMNFPIDIIWITEDLKVAYIVKDARPESYPEAFTPDRDAKYVLEVPSGFSEKNDVHIGDRAELSGFTY